MKKFYNYLDKSYEAIYMKDGHDNLIEVIKIKNKDEVALDKDLIKGLVKEFNLTERYSSQVIENWMIDTITDPLNLLIKNQF